MSDERRLKSCVERWPGCYTMGYDPRCCRFPKSCSCTVYTLGLNAKEEDLEPVPAEVPKAAEPEPPYSAKYLRGLDDEELEGTISERDARIAALEAELAAVRACLNVDRTGLAKALVDIKKTIEGWSWIPAGESASYTYEDDAEEWLRREFGTAIETVSNLAIEALRDSGKIADLAFEDPLFPRPPSAIAAATEQRDDLAKLAQALVDALPKYARTAHETAAPIYDLTAKLAEIAGEKA